uniref:Homeobox domain-containing protein n=1 Tax=Meloidogyne enterolobii TaxID=390850 RepID=A0A6V7XKH6_MELEN|nr:unnamed protein product [Meloidogyne enterolobii]
MYNSNNFTLANSIFDINNHKNYLKEEEKSKDKFEGMINAAVNFGAINNNPAVASSQLNITPLFSTPVNTFNDKNITNNYPLNTIANTNSLQFYNNYQNYFSPTTSLINSAFSTTKTLTTPKTELITFCGQQQQTTKRERTKYTDSQLNYLENIFKNDRYPDGAKREDIARILHLTDVKIQVWFKNRRAKMQNERKFEKARNEFEISRKRAANLNNNGASTSFIKREESTDATEEEEPKSFKNNIGEIKNKKCFTTQVEQNELINKVLKETTSFQSQTNKLVCQTKQIKQQTTTTTPTYQQNNFLPKFENNTNFYLNQQWNNNYLINNNYLNNNSNSNTDYYALMQMAANYNNYFQPQTSNFCASNG